MREHKVGSCLGVLALSILGAGVLGWGAPGPQPIPDEVIRIAKLNLASLARLRTCKAKVEDSLLDATGNREVPLKVIRSLVIWVKARKVREDYALKCEDGCTEPSKAVLDVSTASRRVVTPEISMSYGPGDKHVVIGAGDVEVPLAQNGPALHYFVRVRGNNTLQKEAERLGEKGFAASVSRVVLDGEEADLIGWRRPGSKETFKVWVSPAEGYLVRKVQGVTDAGKLVHERVVHLKQYARDLFWPERGEETYWNEKGDLLRRYTVAVKELAPNVAVDDKLFTLDGLEVPPDVGVRDNTLNVRIRRGDPFDLPEDFVQSVIGEKGATRPSPNTARPAVSTKAPPTTEARPAMSAHESKSGAPWDDAPQRWSKVVPVVVAVALCIGAAFLLLRRRRRAVGKMGDPHL